MKALVCDRRLRSDMIHPLSVCVEDVAIPPGGALLGRGAALYHVPLIDEIYATMRCVVGIDLGSVTVTIEQETGSSFWEHQPSCSQSSGRIEHAKRQCQSFCVHCQWWDRGSERVCFTCR